MTRKKSTHTRKPALFLMAWGQSTGVSTGVGVPLHPVLPLSRRLFVKQNPNVGLKPTEDKGAALPSRPAPTWSPCTVLPGTPTPRRGLPLCQGGHRMQTPSTAAALAGVPGSAMAVA